MALAHPRSHPPQKKRPIFDCSLFCERCVSCVCVKPLPEPKPKPNPIDAKQEASLITGARSMPPSPSPWCKISGTITKRQRRQFSRRGGRAHLFCRQGGTCQHSKALRDPPNCCQLHGKEPKRIPRRGKQEKSNNLQWKNFARSQAQAQLTLAFIFLLANCELRQ